MLFPAPATTVEAWDSGSPQEHTVSGQKKGKDVILAVRLLSLQLTYFAMAKQNTMPSYPLAINFKHMKANKSHSWSLPCNPYSCYSSHSNAFLIDLVLKVVPLRFTFFYPQLVLFDDTVYNVIGIVLILTWRAFLSLATYKQKCIFVHFNWFNTKLYYINTRVLWSLN